MACFVFEHQQLSYHSSCCHCVEYWAFVIETYLTIWWHPAVSSLTKPLLWLLPLEISEGPYFWTWAADSWSSERFNSILKAMSFCYCCDFRMNRQELPNVRLRLQACMNLSDFPPSILGGRHSQIEACVVITQNAWFSQHSPSGASNVPSSKLSLANRHQECIALELKHLDDIFFKKIDGNKKGQLDFEYDFCWLFFNTFQTLRSFCQATYSRFRLCPINGIAQLAGTVEYTDCFSAEG